MNKEYKIETLSDIVNCTNIDNVDNFLADLKGVLLGVYLIKSFDKNKNVSEINGYYIWTDDGAHNISITLKTKDESIT